VDSNVLTALGGLSIAIVTYILAPIINDRVKARNAKVAKVQTDQVTLANRVDERIDKLMEDYDRLRSEAEERLRERDKRIDKLEREIEELRMEVSAYRLGLAAPKGYVVVPLPLWEQVRERLGNEIHGHYTGEAAAGPSSTSLDPPSEP
jgi:hypothetical protein